MKLKTEFEEKGLFLRVFVQEDALLWFLKPFCGFLDWNAAFFEPLEKKMLQLVVTFWVTEKQEKGPFLLFF